ncbi:MAG: glycosyltransferase [Paracoccaceae bacterium]|nr:glycosyltransferase [Paracoccaceae bacterium]
MHVLILNVFFAPNTYGGATVVAEEVGRRLVAEHGVTVSAVSVMTRSDLPPYAVIRGEVDGMATWLVNLPSERGYVGGYLNAEAAERIARIVGDIEPDIAHVHCVQDLGADCLFRLKAAGLPVVLSVHDFWWLCERQFMMRPDGAWCGQSPVRIERCRGCVEDIGRAKARFSALGALADQADVVTYPSRYALDLCEASGLAPGRGVLWENGVRPPRDGFFERQAARRQADPRPVFGFVGGPSRIKGWPLVHDAFAGLGRDGVRGLVVEGSLDGSWWRGRSLARMAGEWRVHPRYGQNTIDEFFAEIDVLLFLSQWKETYGLAIREALARGIRVIQTDSGGSVEHAAADPARLIAIGEGPLRLRREIEAVLDSPAAHPDPLPVVTQSDQARAFLDIAGPLVAGAREPVALPAPVEPARIAAA